LTGVIDASTQDAFLLRPWKELRISVSIPAFADVPWLLFVRRRASGSDILLLANSRLCGPFPPGASARLPVRHQCFRCHETTQRQHASEPPTYLARWNWKLLPKTILISCRFHSSVPGSLAHKVTSMARILSVVGVGTSISSSHYYPSLFLVSFVCELRFPLSLLLQTTSDWFSTLSFVFVNLMQLETYDALDEQQMALSCISTSIRRLSALNTCSICTSHG
jgi:hypothetical protein